MPNNSDKNGAGFMEIFVTVTGYNHYFGKGIFNLGETFILRAEPDNPHDKYAVAVYSPKYGRCGYIANSRNTAALGTELASFLYDLDIDGTIIKIRFIADGYILASFDKPEKVIFD